MMRSKAKLLENLANKFLEKTAYDSIEMDDIDMGYEIEKAAQSQNSDLTGTIERASGRPEFGIPNFRQIIGIRNSKEPVKMIKTLSITMNVESTSEVAVTSVEVIPGPGSTASNTDIAPIIDSLKTSIPKYFAKYPETINHIVAGTYVAAYEFESTPAAGI